MSVTINGPVTSTDSFAVSPLSNAIADFGVAITDPQKVAAASTAAGVPGDNGIANQISQLTGSPLSPLGNDNFSGYYSSLISTIGAIKQSTSDGLTFNNNLLSELTNRLDSISGVNLDDEATKLMMFQRSYEAGAQVIKVADELIQTLLNL